MKKNPYVSYDQQENPLTDNPYISNDGECADEYPVSEDNTIKVVNNKYMSDEGIPDGFSIQVETLNADFEDNWDNAINNVVKQIKQALSLQSDVKIKDSNGNTIGSVEFE